MPWPPAVDGGHFLKTFTFFAEFNFSHKVKKMFEFLPDMKHSGDTVGKKHRCPMNGFLGN